MKRNIKWTSQSEREGEEHCHGRAKFTIFLVVYFRIHADSGTTMKVQNGESRCSLKIFKFLFMEKSVPLVVLEQKQVLDEMRIRLSLISWKTRVEGFFFSVRRRERRLNRGYFKMYFMYFWGNGTRYVKRRERNLVRRINQRLKYGLLILFVSIATLRYYLYRTACENFPRHPFARPFSSPSSIVIFPNYSHPLFLFALSH